jgi:microcystin degradation protein MlrC
MRVGLAGIFHETNTFCAEKTTEEAFTVWRGGAILERFQGTQTYIGGVLAGCEAAGSDVRPLLFAEAEPSGIIAHDAYRRMRDEIIDRLSKTLPVDALILTLHGAGVVDGIDDLEGDLCRAVRELVDSHVPLVVTLDLHAAITSEMVHAATLILGVNHYPHLDMYERGYEAAAIIPRLVSGEVKPIIHVERLPMLLVASSTIQAPTDASPPPAAQANELCRAHERRHDVLDVTFFHGFPYADTANTQACVMATTNDDLPLAKECAQEIADWVWKNRGSFSRSGYEPYEAVALALSTEGAPVIINETSDNPGAGTPGDGTYLLRAMLESEMRESACFGALHDPEVAALAHRVGPTATIDVELGGKSDDLHGKPVSVSAYIKSVTDGVFLLQAMSRGLKCELGPCARLQVGTIDIIVSSKRMQVFDPELFLLHGIDVTRCKVVGVKSSNHFRAGFEPIASAIITADSPGLSTLRLDYLPARTKTPRPIWPLDQDAVYSLR